MDTPPTHTHTYQAETDYSMFEVDGEEEPLFADDLNDLDDDPPPLPPPMPSLSQLSQRTGSRAANLRVNSNSQENFGGSGATGTCRVGKHFVEWDQLHMVLTSCISLYFVA